MNITSNKPSAKIDSVTIDVFTKMLVNEYNYPLTRAKEYINVFLQTLDNHGYTIAYNQFLANLISPNTKEETMMKENIMENTKEETMMKENIMENTKEDDMN